MGQDPMANPLGLPAPFQKDWQLAMAETLAVQGRNSRNDTHKDTSTVSSSQDTTESKYHRYLTPNFPPQSTLPTSQSSSGLLDLINQKKEMESDLEVRYGSDFVRPGSSSESSSSGSVGSRHELPKPDREQNMKGIGGHLINPLQHLDPPGLRPRTDVEARVVMDSMKRATATNRAADTFESHILTQLNSTPELAVQRAQISFGPGVRWRTRKRREPHLTPVRADPPMVDIEELGYDGGTAYNRRAMIFVVAIMAVFVLLTIALYSQSWMMWIL